MIEEPSQTPLIHLIQKVYQDLRNAEKQLPKLKAEEILNLKNIQNFLELHLSDNAEKKLQDILYHIKNGMSAQQFEFLLVPFERYLQKNLKDDDFIVFSSDSQNVVQKFPIHIVLENLRSSFNVGSFVRIADGLGIQSLHLCGYTPYPSKTAMGAEEAIAIQQNGKTEHCILKLKENGFYIVGIETTNKSIPYTAPYNFEKPIAFVFGNERFGLNYDTLRLCDELRSIPMHGMKNSMNVAVCGGIILSEWVRQYL